MKRYVIKFKDGGREVEREFASKPEAFRWFNWECPANEASLMEVDEDGRRGPAKNLRRRDPFGAL